MSVWALYMCECVGVWALYIGHHYGCFGVVLHVLQEIKNITNVKRCRDGMPKSMQTR